jgi:hypothetical protein
MEKITSNDTPVPLLGEDWFDPLEAGVRQRIRSFIEAMLESELDAATAGAMSALGCLRDIVTATVTGRSSAPSARPRCRCRVPGWSRPTARHGNGGTGRCPPTNG